LDGVAAAAVGEERGIVGSRVFNAEGGGELSRPAAFLCNALSGCAVAEVAIESVKRGAEERAEAEAYVDGFTEVIPRKVGKAGSVARDVGLKHAQTCHERDGA